MNERPDTPLPEWWNWKSGGYVKCQRMKNKQRYDVDVPVDELIARKSDFVANKTMTVAEWLAEAKQLWIRDHPEHANR